MWRILTIIFLCRQAAASSIVRQEGNYRADQHEYVSQAVNCQHSDISTCCFLLLKLIFMPGGFFLMRNPFKRIIFKGIHILFNKPF